MTLQPGNVYHNVNKMISIERRDISIVPYGLDYMKIFHMIEGDKALVHRDLRNRFNPVKKRRR